MAFFKKKFNVRIGHRHVDVERERVMLTYILCQCSSRVLDELGAGVLVVLLHQVETDLQ